MALKRLQKIIQAAGKASRRAAEEMILSGRVSINGKITRKLGTKADAAADDIRLDGKPLGAEEKHVYLFHKPRGVTSTMRDPHAQKTLAVFLKKLPVRTFAVGRLDRDASGLVVITNDGEFAERLLHPRFEVPRVYLALVEGVLALDEERQLLRGILLEDGRARASAARSAARDKKALKAFGMQRLAGEEDIIEVTVAEGRKHYVKRLLAACGHPVKRLIRVQYGPYQLGALREGEIREVERVAFRRSSGRRRRQVDN